MRELYERLESENPPKEKKFFENGFEAPFVDLSEKGHMSNLAFKTDLKMIKGQQKRFDGFCVWIEKVYKKHFGPRSRVSKEFKGMLPELFLALSASSYYGTVVQGGARHGSKSLARALRMLKAEGYIDYQPGKGHNQRLTTKILVKGIDPRILLDFNTREVEQKILKAPKPLKKVTYQEPRKVKYTVKKKVDGKIVEKERTKTVWDDVSVELPADSEGDTRILSMYHDFMSEVDCRICKDGYVFIKTPDDAKEKYYRVRCTEDGTVIDPRLTRVFSYGKRKNEEPIDEILKNKRYARLYTSGPMSFQGIDSNDRLHTKFDGMPVVEIDFKCMQFAICYNLMKLDMDFDAYNIFELEEGEEGTRENRIYNAVRDMVKPMGVRFLGCKKASLLEGSMWKYCQSNPHLHHIPTLVGAPKPNKLHYFLTMKMLDFHEPIKHFFGREFTNELQRIDSEIMLKIIAELTIKKIPHIPIHDSIVMQDLGDGHIEEVKQIMNDCYKSILKFDIKLSHDSLRKRKKG